jgi:hypothetical protein
MVELIKLSITSTISGFTSNPMNKTEAYNCRKRSNDVANDVARIVKTTSSEYSGNKFF